MIQQVMGFPVPSECAQMKEWVAMMCLNSFDLCVFRQLSKTFETGSGLADRENPVGGVEVYWSDCRC